MIFVLNAVFVADVLVVKVPVVVVAQAQVRCHLAPEFSNCHALQVRLGQEFANRRNNPVTADRPMSGIAPQAARTSPGDRLDSLRGAWA